MDVLKNFLCKKLQPYIQHVKLIRNGNGSQNLFNFCESAINQLKKKDLVIKVLKLKYGVVVVTQIHSLCDQIKDLSEIINQLLAKNDQLNSELIICKNTNKCIEEKVTKLDRAQATAEQYGWRNNVELAGIFNYNRDNAIERTISNMFKGCSTYISPVDIEACHRLPLSNAQVAQDPEQCKSQC